MFFEGDGMNGLASVLASVTLLAAPAADRSDDYYAAYRKAEAAHKLLLVDFGTGASLEAASPDHRGRHVVCRLTTETRLPGFGSRPSRCT